MPHKNKADRNKKWVEWYHAHKEEYDRRYAERRRNNRQRISQNQRAYYQRLRLDVITHYGGKCECCGEDKIEFLAIDHVNGRGSGAAHRKQLGFPTGSWFYLWIIKNNYPLGLRILCHNCNFSLGAYGYCPHSENNSGWLSEFEAHEAVLWRIIKCEYCGKEKRTKSLTAHFCSNQCWQRATRNAERVKLGKQIPESRDCAYCGKQFKPRTYKTFYCSKECCMKNWNLQHAEENRIRCLAYYKEHKKPNLLKYAEWLIETKQVKLPEIKST